MLLTSQFEHFSEFIRENLDVRKHASVSLCEPLFLGGVCVFVPFVSFSLISSEKGLYSELKMDYVNNTADM